MSLLRASWVPKAANQALGTTKWTPKGIEKGTKKYQNCFRHTKSSMIVGVDLSYFVRMSCVLEDDATLEKPQKTVGSLRNRCSHKTELSSSHDFPDQDIVQKA